MQSDEVSGNVQNQRSNDATHTMKVRVRFSDTDMLGHVNNSRYFTYMEEARCAFFDEVLDFKDPGIPIILASARVNFLAQTFYRQTLRIESYVSRWGNSSFDVVCRMYDDVTDALQFEGVAVLVYFDYEAQKPRRIPEEYRQKLAPYTHES